LGTFGKREKLLGRDPTFLSNLILAIWHHMSLSFFLVSLIYGSSQTYATLHEINEPKHHQIYAFGVFIIFRDTISTTVKMCFFVLFSFIRKLAYFCLRRQNSH